MAVGTVVLGVTLARNLVHPAVALVAVLGLRTVGMLGTHSLIIHGPRASRPANVCRVERLTSVPCITAGFVTCIVQAIIYR